MRKLIWITLFLYVIIMYYIFICYIITRNIDDVIVSSYDYIESQGYNYQYYIDNNYGIISGGSCRYLVDKNNETYIITVQENTDGFEIIKKILIK